MGERFVGMVVSAVQNSSRADRSKRARRSVIQLLINDLNQTFPANTALPVAAPTPPGQDAPSPS